MLTFRLSNLYKRKDSLPVHTIETDTVGLRFYPRREEDPGYVVEVLRKLNGGDCLVIGVICQEDLQQAIMLLQEAIAWVNDHAGTPRQLQTTWLWGATYYADERLGELRRKDDPSDRVLFARP